MRRFYVSNSYFTYPISATMLAFSRYRRFILLLVICCISFFVFGWYTKVEETSTTNERFEISVQDTVNDIEIIPTEYAYQTEISKEEDLPASKTFFKFIKKKINEHVFNANEDKIRHHVENLDLLSGPTESTFDIRRMTKPWMEYVDMEMENSGPTEDTLVEVTFPSMRHPGWEMEMENSGPTEDTFLDITLPSIPHQDIQPKKSIPKEIMGDSLVKQVKSLVGDKLDKLNSLLSKQSGKTKKEKYPKLTLKATTPAYAVTEQVKNPGLILDTPACKIPKLDPWDPTVIGLYEKTDAYECPGPPLFMKSQPDGSITISETILLNHYNVTMDEVSCYYQTIHRKHEDEGNVRENDYVVGNLTEMKFGVPLNEDYVAVLCNLGGTDFEQYFPLVRLKPEIEKERSSIPPVKPKLNVILAGIDSISKLNFLRHFPRTHAFLKEKMDPFEMNGYTKVGDNTFPNLVPLLTGHFVEHYWNESVRDTMYFDHLDLIWKDYASRGFRTFYAEDSPYTGTFNYIKRGFYDPPTDYYFRPLALALENSRVKEKSLHHCINSQIETDVIYDYLRDFLQAMGERPHIAFAMVSTLTHDYLNKAGYADEPAVHMLESLHSSGALNNSMLVLFSDHGLRFGAIRQTYIGKFEERMPFMFVHFPKWFLDQNPQIAKNLHDNQDRLITLFDVHATMIDLLDLEHEMSLEEKASITLGSSLLREISPNRTCDDANILPHWCPCQTHEEVATNDTIAVRCAQAIVDDINTKLEPYNGSCAVLEIDNISDARVGLANDLVLRFVRHDNVVVNRTVIYGDKVSTLGDYLITLTTKPGGAVFEGTVRHDAENNSYTVLGISRINMYGNQSHCVDSQKMKIFCYCPT